MGLRIGRSERTSNPPLRRGPPAAECQEPGYNYTIGTLNLNRKRR
jgi:hypothetical protein